MGKKQDKEKSNSGKKERPISKSRVLVQKKRNDSNLMRQINQLGPLYSMQSIEREQFLKTLKKLFNMQAKYFEVFAISLMAIYDRVCKRSISLNGNQDFVQQREIRDLLGGCMCHFLCLFNLMIKPHQMHLANTLQQDVGQYPSNTQIRKSFAYVLNAIRESQNLNSQDVWVQCSIKQIMSVYIISLLLEGIVENDIHIDYYYQDEENPEVLAMSIFQKMQILCYCRVHQLLKQTKLLTRNVFDYLAVNYQQITTLVSGELMSYYSQNIHENTQIRKVEFPPLTIEGLLGLDFVKVSKVEQIEEKVERNNDEQKIEKVDQDEIMNMEENIMRHYYEESDELYYDQSSISNSFYRIEKGINMVGSSDESHDIPSVHDNQSLQTRNQLFQQQQQTIQPSEYSVRPIDIQLAKRVYKYGEKKRDRREESKNRNERVRKEHNRSILNERLQQLQKKRRLTLQEQNEMDYIDNVLNNQQDLIDEIDLNKIHLSIRDKIKRKKTSSRQGVKHENRQTDKLIVQLIENEMAIAQAVANHIYYSLLAYKIIIHSQ